MKNINIVKVSLYLLSVFCACFLIEKNVSARSVYAIPRHWGNCVIKAYDILETGELLERQECSVDDGAEVVFIFVVLFMEVL